MLNKLDKLRTKKYVFLTITIIAILGGSLGGGYMMVSSTLADTACPQIHNPRPLREMLSWGKVFDPTYASFAGTPAVYGINMWQVKEANLVSSIQNMVAQGGSGLVISGGQIHSVDIYRDEDRDLFTVVFIYEWESDLAETDDNEPPIFGILTLMQFYPMVEAYNWTMATELEPDPSVYAGMIDRQFHAHLCDYPE